MARVFITGSSDGLGLMAAQLLVEMGHAVVLHARSASRAEDARRRLPGCETVAVGDLASLDETRSLAEQVNRLGRFDAVIHNAGVGLRERLTRTAEGLPHVFAINVLAPYVLTALIERPKPARLPELRHAPRRRPHSRRRRLDEAALAGVCRLLREQALRRAARVRRREAIAERLLERGEPGWVATKMGGPGAPDDEEDGRRTQVWLAVSDDPEARVSGKYFHHLRPQACDPAAHDPARQDKLLELCQRFSGVALAGE